MPDSIRSSLACSGGGNVADAPQACETVVMPPTSDAVRCYAVGDDLTPRPLCAAQFVAVAAECEPGAPTQPLPENTNARVNAAAGAFSNGSTCSAPGWRASPVSVAAPGPDGENNKIWNSPADAVLPSKPEEPGWATSVRADLNRNQGETHIKGG